MRIRMITGAANWDTEDFQWLGPYVQLHAKYAKSGVRSGRL